MTWTEKTETDYFQKNCGNVSKMLQETHLQSFLKNYAPGAKAALNAKDGPLNVDLILLAEFNW